MKLLQYYLSVILYNASNCQISLSTDLYHVYRNTLQTNDQLSPFTISQYFIWFPTNPTMGQMKRHLLLSSCITFCHQIHHLVWSFCDGNVPNEITPTLINLHHSLCRLSHILSTNDRTKLLISCCKIIGQPVNRWKQAENTDYFNELSKQVYDHYCILA